MKTPTVTFNLRLARLVLLLLALLSIALVGIFPVLAEAPIALLVAGAATVLGALPGPVVLIAVLGLGWHVNRRFPPAAAPAAAGPVAKRRKPKRPAPRST